MGRRPEPFDHRTPGPTGGETTRGEPMRDPLREREADVPEERDDRPALGTHGQPGAYGQAVEGAPVELHGSRFEDMRWSFLYEPEDTAYRNGASTDVAAAARRARSGDEVPDVVQGPVMKPAVWTWEVPLYFWFGGIAAGASFVSMACDLVGDRRSASLARKVALGALVPCPPLLVSDLGRPLRFYNMLRIFKPRSPMSMGAWCLTAFGNLAALAVGADLLGRRREARALGATNAVLGAYLGSYGGVLLASTAVPVWARSRLVLGPIFVATAAATGAAAVRLTLVARGLDSEHPTRVALGRIETGAMAAELAMSSVHERRMGPVGDALEQGRAGQLFRAAKWSARAGLALRLARGRAGPRAHHLASALYLFSGLAFRYAWVRAGDTSAHDDREVARMARGKGATGG